MSAGIDGDGLGVCWEGEWGEVFSPWRCALIGWVDQARIIGKVARAFRIEPPGVEFRRVGPPKERGRLRKQKFNRVIELYPPGWDAATLGHLLVHAVVAHHMKREDGAHDSDFQGVARMLEVELRETVAIAPSTRGHLLLGRGMVYARVVPGPEERRTSELGIWREEWELFELSLSAALRLAGELGSVHVAGVDRRVNPHKFKKTAKELVKGDKA